MASSCAVRNRDRKEGQQALGRTAQCHSLFLQHLRDVLHAQLRDPSLECAEKTHLLDILQSLPNARGKGKIQGYFRDHPEVEAQFNLWFEHVSRFDFNFSISNRPRAPRAGPAPQAQARAQPQPPPSQPRAQPQPPPSQPRARHDLERREQKSKRGAHRVSVSRRRTGAVNIRLHSISPQGLLIQDSPARHKKRPPRAGAASALPPPPSVTRRSSEAPGLAFRRRNKN